jgi:hypothetical protein
MGRDERYKRLIVTGHVLSGDEIKFRVISVINELCSIHLEEMRHASAAQEEPVDGMAGAVVRAVVYFR